MPIYNIQQGRNGVSTFIRFPCDSEIDPEWPEFEDNLNESQIFSFPEDPPSRRRRRQRDRRRNCGPETETLNDDYVPYPGWDLGGGDREGRDGRMRPRETENLQDEYVPYPGWDLGEEDQEGRRGLTGSREPETLEDEYVPYPGWDLGDGENEESHRHSGQSGPTSRSGGCQDRHYHSCGQVFAAEGGNRRGLNMRRATRHRGSRHRGQGELEGDMGHRGSFGGGWDRDLARHEDSRDIEPHLEGGIDGVMKRIADRQQRRNITNGLRR
ncbi:hypothetical protein AYL99_07914 [Fonsecaea erecta]|uniref:Uncharacterized protein n=1 Tax=Fonsecaea erecta TaxID=1367422 RepID=A0A178ZCH5_9EURO|nr:hypothetical protein AYL99_07914 [Fonsecaea erecta]OAP57176.1 hypothetical protein AYL99_07914 [Fonsecaea erecta]